VEPKLTRVARNLAVSLSSALAVRLAETPVVQPVSRMVERRRLGILKCLSLPPPLEIALAVALMDYTLYIWHRLMHGSRLIWRFHLPHHVDLDLDASTALRFHFSELVLSVPWRAGQVLAIGVSPGALSTWQKALMFSILFHHSNVRLPLALEKWLCRIIVTPRLHGIHHSIVAEEQNSNWSSGLTIWDRLHGTYRANVPQAEITIGVPAYREPKDVTLPKSLAMPLHELPRWQLPDGTVPKHAPAGVPRNRLLS
jgi:sterol desaturase/sphingolipid hydroxylase (fatty acid hydroxylase superfamily)